MPNSVRDWLKYGGQANEALDILQDLKNDPALSSDFQKVLPFVDFMRATLELLSKGKGREAGIKLSSPEALEVFIKVGSVAAHNPRVQQCVEHVGAACRTLVRNQGGIIKDEFDFSGDT